MENADYPLGMLVSGGPRPDFDTEESFYTSDKGYKIVLLVRGNSPARFFIIPNTYKRVLQLNATEYGEHITRLLNLVRAQFPDAEDYVNHILEEAAIDDHIQDRYPYMFQGPPDASGALRIHGQLMKQNG